MFDSESANGRNEDDTLFVQFKHMPCNGLDTVNQDRPLPLVIAGPSGVVSVINFRMRYFLSLLLSVLMYSSFFP